MIFSLIWWLSGYTDYQMLMAICVLFDIWFSLIFYNTTFKLWLDRASPRSVSSCSLQIIYPIFLYIYSTNTNRNFRTHSCTFIGCDKTFANKGDWKRHESSQHFLGEMWRCDEERPDSEECGEVYYRRQTFQNHLKEEHNSDDDAIESKVELCCIGRNCQVRFWCGFCIKLIDLRGKGLDAWTERFDHIDNHFMGRGLLTRQGIQDWVHVDSKKPKGDGDEVGSTWAGGSQ
jgi:hypothetical protein